MIRMIRQPTGSIDGLALEKYHVPQTYELEPVLADFLILEGYAASEMRRLDRRSQRRNESIDRRRGNFTSQLRRFGRKHMTAT